MQPNGPQPPPQPKIPHPPSQPKSPQPGEHPKIPQFLEPQPEPLHGGPGVPVEMVIGGTGVRGEGSVIEYVG